MPVEESEKRALARSKTGQTVRLGQLGLFYPGQIDDRRVNVAFARDGGGVLKPIRRSLAQRLDRAALAIEHGPERGERDRCQACQQCRRPIWDQYREYR